MKKPSRVTHQRQIRLADDNIPSVSPIYQSAKFVTETLSDTLGIIKGRKEGFSYSRYQNPTLYELELLLSELQGTEAGLVTASGISAISTLLLSLLNKGDHIIIFLESYKTARSFVRNILPRYGIEHDILSITQLSDLEDLIKRKKTKAILFESPSNPVLRIPDIGLITALAKEHEVTTVFDNTFGSFSNHGDYDLDYFVHSLTKYAGGHSDVTGGVVLGKRDNIQRLRPFHSMIGAALDPHAAFLIQRGLKTFFVRFERQCENAFKVAKFLDADPRVSNLHYPGLPSHPDYKLAFEQMNLFGSLLSVDIGSSRQEMEKFIDALSLFGLAFSIGSTESLVAPCRLFYGGDLSETQFAAAGLGENTVRLSIGIEDIGDLIADLDLALSKIHE